MNESRVYHTLKNLTFSLITSVLKFILGLILRIVFLRYLSVEYLGLNSLFANILTVLSIAELGIESAIAFAMYKPMAEKNFEKVRQLLELYKKFYTIIGFIVLIIGICLLPFLKFLITDEPKIQINIYLLFGIYLLNSVVSYFFSYRRIIFLTSQRKDIESKISAVVSVALISVQILAVVFFKNFYIYAIVNTFFILLENLIVVFVTNKLYPEISLKPESKLDIETKKLINKSVYGLLYHRIGNTILFSIDTIIISRMLGLTVLGVYSNYIIITVSVSGVIGMIIESVRGSIGNFVTVESNKAGLTLFKRLNFFHSWLISFCAICFVTLFQDFIVLWIGTEYLLDFFTMLAIALSFYFVQSRNVVICFKESNGIFFQDRFKSIFEIIIKLSVTILLVYFVGLIGIMIGTITTILLVSVGVESYMLYKFYFKERNKNFLLQYILWFLLTVSVGAITFGLCSLIPSQNWIYFALKIVICAIFPNIIYLSLFFKTDHMKYILDKLKRIKIKK